MGLTSAQRVAHWRHLKRLALILCCAVVVLAAAAVILLRAPKKPVSGPLALPDGSSVRVLAVTYGTNHVVGSPLAKLGTHLPARGQMLLSRLFGQRATACYATVTPTPAMVVWLERLTNAVSATPLTGEFEALLSDGRGFSSGEAAPLRGWSSPEQLHFRVFPRREAGFALEFFYHDRSGNARRCGRLPLANPAPGQFPQWRPEALPASHCSGEVEMTLEALSTGHDTRLDYVPWPGGGHALNLSTNRLDGRNHTACLVRLHSLTRTNEVWKVAGVEVSDATGNQVQNTGMSYGAPEEGYFSFEPGLWPNEAAWKLKCEIKRAQGFAPGETFTFQGVPLGAVSATTRPNWTTNFGGLTVTLTQLVRRAPQTNHFWSGNGLSDCTFTIAGLKPGMHLDLLSACTDNGTNLATSWWGGSGTKRDYYFRTIPLDARTADFTFAVQQARWVEFTVKPAMGAGRIEYPPTWAP